MLRFAHTVSTGIVILLCGVMSPQHVFAAERYALLIGVTEYPALKGRNLRGPRNDVQLLRETLLKNGFDAKHIVIVADDVPKSLNAIEPTRMNILQSFDQMVGHLQQGDFLLVQFSGHGSQQPEQEVGQEPDGLDEIFLPRDVTQWDSKAKTVVGAITDDEIGARLRVISAKGASVWAIFDTCSSGSMTRGEADVLRRVEPAALGVPPIEAVPTTRGGTAPVPAPAKAVLDGADASGVVAFFATTPYAPTPEYRPWTGLTSYGLFTYVLNEGLQAYPGITYRQLGQFVHQRYGSLNPPERGMPYFEGNLDAPVFGDASVVRVRQWPLRRRDQKIEIAAGSLSLFSEDALFALLPDPRAPTTSAIGYARAVNVTPGTSQLMPIEYDGKPAIDGSRREVESLYARLLNPKLRFDVRVATRFDERAARAPAVVRDAIRTALARLRSDTAQGLRVTWTDDVADADVEVLISEDRIFLLAGGAPLVRSGKSRTLSIALRTGDESGLSADALGAQLTDELSRVTRAVSLLKIASTQLYSQSDASLSLQLTVRRQGASAPVPVQPNELPDLSPGDRLFVEVDKKGSIPVDVTVLGMDANYRIHALFPRPQEPANRILPEGRRTVPAEGIRLDDKAFGVERLIVLVSPQPRSTDTGASDYTYLADGAARTRTGSASRNSDLDDMLDEVFVGSRHGTRSERRTDETAMWVFSWQTVPPK